MEMQKSKIKECALMYKLSYLLISLSWINSLAVMQEAKLSPCTKIAETDFLQVTKRRVCIQGAITIYWWQTFIIIIIILIATPCCIHIKYLFV